MGTTLTRGELLHLALMSSENRAAHALGRTYPGGMGTFHFLVISALTLFYGVRGDDAFSSANIFFFSVNIGFTILLGLASLAALPLLDRRQRGAGAGSW